MCHEEIRTSTEVEHVDVYKHTLNIHIIILLHMYAYAVYSTQHWILLPVVVQ